MVCQPLIKVINLGLIYFIGAGIVRAEKKVSSVSNGACGMTKIVNDHLSYVDNTKIIKPAIFSKDSLQARPNLFDLGEMEVRHDHEAKTLWTYMAPNGSPNFSDRMLDEILIIQSELPQLYERGDQDLKYLVLASKFPGVFNLGGDLALFAALIESGDREKLTNYATKCIDVFYNNYTASNLPIVTIALIQGDALGGGFEAALSFNVIVAERGAKFGLPETLFGLFPGMGAHAKLARLLGAAKAERMILSGCNYSAEELHEMGIVHILAEPGQGEQVVRDYIRGTSTRQEGLCRTFSAMREVMPLTYDELNRIVSLWVETALLIDRNNLRLMLRLSRAQTRLASAHLTG